MQQLSAALDAGTWERRQQLIGATISSRAVLEAAKDPAILKLAEEDGAVSRGDIMNFIAESPRFEGWVKQMLSKLEDKSYQTSITKALLRAGYIRTGSSGRYIKWLLPADDGDGAVSHSSDPKHDSSHPAGNPPGASSSALEDDQDHDTETSKRRQSSDEGEDSVDPDNEHGGGLDEENADEMSEP
jgi:hypothetical protein